MASSDDTGNSDPESKSPTNAILEEINQQTGVIDWQELVKHFARGVVIRVDAGLDLVKVAHSMSLDDKTQMQHWLNRRSIRPATDAHVRAQTTEHNVVCRFLFDTSPRLRDQMHSRMPASA